MKYILKNRLKSFTLLEVLITLVISSIIIISTLLIFFNANFENLNQRKQFSKINEIYYSLDYIENELKNAVYVNVNDGNLHILNYTYNGFIDNVDSQKIKNIKQIDFVKEIEKDKVSVYRISLDILNKLDDGKNKLISNLDGFEIFFEGGKVLIKISYRDMTFEREIFLDNIKRFDYEN